MTPHDVKNWLVFRCTLYTVSMNDTLVCCKYTDSKDIVNMPACGLSRGKWKGQFKMPGSKFLSDWFKPRVEGCFHGLDVGLAKICGCTARDLLVDTALSRCQVVSNLEFRRCFAPNDAGGKVASRQRHVI